MVEPSEEESTMSNIKAFVQRNWGAAAGHVLPPLPKELVLAAIKEAQSDGGGITPTEWRDIRNLKGRTNAAGTVALQVAQDLMEVRQTPSGSRVVLDVATIEKEIAALEREIQRRLIPRKAAMPLDHHFYGE
jgi:hypothetical protein